MVRCYFYVFYIIYFQEMSKFFIAKLRFVIINIVNRYVIFGKQFLQNGDGRCRRCVSRYVENFGLSGMCIDNYEVLFFIIFCVIDVNAMLWMIWLYLRCQWSYRRWFFNLLIVVIVFYYLFDFQVYVRLLQIVTCYFFYTNDVWVIYVQFF